MKKNGFTLVELLAVVVILALITLMGTVGVSSLKDGINKSMWNSTVELIETAAKRYGEDKKNIIINKNESCTINGVSHNPGYEVTVEDLISKKYIATKEYATKNGQEVKVLVNNTIEKSKNESDNFTNGYYVNNGKVCIYIEDNLSYAKYIG